MRTMPVTFYVAIFLQVIVGVGLIFIQPGVFGMLPEGMLGVWVGTLRLVVIPVACFFLWIKEFPFRNLLMGMWQGWLIATTGWIFAVFQTHYRSINIFGLALLSLIMMTGLSATIPILQELFRRQKSS